MSKILSGLEGVLLLMDDVLVFGKDQKKHDEHLQAALKRIKEARATLNPAKCFFSQLRFLGHIFDQEGIRADLDKTSAITVMKPPTNVADLANFQAI